MAREKPITVADVIELLWDCVLKIDVAKHRINETRPAPFLSEHDRAVLDHVYKELWNLERDVSKVVKAIDK